DSPRCSVAVATPAVSGMASAATAARARNGCSRRTDMGTPRGGRGSLLGPSTARPAARVPAPGGAGGEAGRGGRGAGGGGGGRAVATSLSRCAAASALHYKVLDEARIRAVSSCA